MVLKVSIYFSIIFLLLFFLVGSGEAGSGEPPVEPDVTLTLTSRDLQAMLEGRVSAVSSYMSGSLQVEGSVSDASKLGDLVDVIKSKM